MKGLAGGNRSRQATNLNVGVWQLGRVLVGTAGDVSSTPQHVRTHVKVANVANDEYCFFDSLILSAGNAVTHTALHLSST